MVLVIKRSVIKVTTLCGLLGVDFFFLMTRLMKAFLNKFYKSGTPKLWKNENSTAFSQHITYACRHIFKKKLIR